MADDRATRLSVQLVRKVRQFYCRPPAVGAETAATLTRTRYRDEDEIAWQLTVPMQNGSTERFCSKQPAHEVSTAKEWRFESRPDNSTLISIGRR